MKRESITRVAVSGILLTGAILRTVQYAAIPSMSSDEVALALNVTDRGWNALLFQPLMHFQIAPPGFLFVEKIAVAIGGDTEAAFRFFPYLMSLASLFLFWRLARRYLDPATMLSALIVFAASPTLVLYAGIAKQYAGDIAITLLLLLFALRFLEAPVRPSSAAIMGIAGGVALLFSQPAVLVAFGLSALLLVVTWRNRGSAPGGWPARRIATLLAGWAIGAAGVTYTSVTNLSAATSDYMERFWRTSFVPPPWLGWEELLWIPRRLAETITHLVAYVNTPESLPALALAGAYGLLLLLGLPHLVKRSPLMAIILAVPVVVAIVAAIVRLLPLSGRLSLFIGPSLLIGTFAGFDRIRTWMPVRAGIIIHVASIGFATLPALALLAKAPPPRILNGTRPVLEQVKADWQPGDRLVVSRGMWTLISVEYYARRTGIGEWTHVDRIGGNHTAEEIIRGYLHALDAFRGLPRVWLYLEGTVFCEDEAMFGYLNAIGKRLRSARYQTNAHNRISAQLFDLSDPELLARMNAETFPVPECRD